MDKQYVQAGILSYLGDMLGKSMGKWFKPIGDMQSWVKQMTSPIKNFSVSDGDAEVDEPKGVVRFEMDLQSEAKITDIKGNPIDLKITLVATNVKEVIGPALDAILEFRNKLKTKDLDGISDAAEKAKEALNEMQSYIGVQLPSGTTYEKLPTVWQEFAKKLEFALKCESTGRDSGEIEGKNLENCIKLIGEYLTKVGITEFVGEATIDANVIILPVLTAIQQWIGKYMLEIYKSNMQDGIALTPDNSNDAEDQSVSEFSESDDDFQEGLIPYNSAKCLSVNLHKVLGSDTITLTAIKANYAPGDALTDLDMLLSEDEFVGALTYEPQTFNITTIDDQFDIQTADTPMPVIPEESLVALFTSAIKMYRNLYMIHWLSYGNDMEKLHLLAEELYTELIKQIDAIGELLVEKTGTIPNIHQIDDTFEIRNYTFQDGLCVLTSMLQEFIDVIDITYPNQPSDVQSILDDWLRYWTKQLNYFIQRQISE